MKNIVLIYLLNTSNYYLDSIIKIYNTLHDLKKTNKKKYLNSLLNYDINYIFYNKIEEINSIIGQQQIEMINNTINIIETSNKEKLEGYKKININRSLQWCIKHNVEYNKADLYENAFIQ